MRLPSFHKGLHARLSPRQGVVHAGPAGMPHGAAQDTSYSVYLTAGSQAMTATGVPTATFLIFDTNAVSSPTPVSRTIPASITLLPTETVSVQDAATTSLATTTSLASVTPPASSVNNTIPIEIDPFQRVYTAMTLNALNSRPPWVIYGAIISVVFTVLLVGYCYACRWYYKRLPRSTARWDVDDQARKNLVYGDQPHFSPEDEKPVQLVDDDRKSVPVGDSYFPQGETWRKFEGRTARHPESFIYTGSDPGSPGSPNSPGHTPHSGTALARPRPRFAHAPRRGQIDSVFSTVSFPTTHRADSIRDSNFYPDGYEHDGEVWDLASPAFVAGENGGRPSLDSTGAARSTIVNRGSIFAEASARARGSIVVYDSSPVRRSFMLDEDPFAEGNGTAYVYPVEKYAGKKSTDGGKRSTDGFPMHMRNRSKDVKGGLGTLVEDADEDMTRSGKSTPIPHL